MPINITITAPDAQDGTLMFYRTPEGVHFTKTHQTVATGGSNALVPPYDGLLAAALTALVNAGTITAPQRTAFVAVLSALNTYATTESGL